MPVFEAFLQALVDKSSGKVNPLKLAQAIGNFAGQVEAYTDSRVQSILVQLVGPWSTTIARLAPTKWQLPVHVPPSCDMDVQPGRSCGQFAIGGCVICGRPICLQHALVAADATIVCWPCMIVAGKHATKWQPRAGAAGSAVASSAWAYELLGVAPDCTDEQLRHAFKQRVARFHPDRVEPGQDPKPNGDLVKMIKRAYDMIVDERNAAK